MRAGSLVRVIHPVVSSNPCVSNVQATNTWFVALVNDTADESSKMLTAKYSIAEVAYFRSLVRRRPTPQRLLPSDQNHLISGWPVAALPSDKLIEPHQVQVAPGSVHGPVLCTPKMTVHARTDSAHQRRPPMPQCHDS